MVVGSIFSLTTLTVAENQVAGPQGGRLLDVDGLQAEFLIDKDHNVSLTFYNEQLERIPATTQVATLTAEAPSGKQKIEFESKNGNLVLKEPLPDGHGYNLVVQLRKDDASKFKNFRIPLETSVCDECGNAEYACTCDGH